MGGMFEVVRLCHMSYAPLLIKLDLKDIDQNWGQRLGCIQIYARTSMLTELIQYKSGQEWAESIVLEWEAKTVPLSATAEIPSLAYTTYHWYHL